MKHCICYKIKIWLLTSVIIINKSTIKWANYRFWSTMAVNYWKNCGLQEHGWTTICKFDQVQHKSCIDKEQLLGSKDILSLGYGLCYGNEVFASELYLFMIW